MTILVFSDLHDNLPNLETCFNWANNNQVDAAIFLGDLTNADTLLELASLWPKEFYFIQGNCDTYLTSDIPSYPQWHNVGRYGQIIVDKRHIGLCHEPRYWEEVLREGSVEVLFYGHSHKPWEELDNNTWLVNPGTLGGIYYPASFALYDTVNNVWKLKTLSQLKI